MLQFPIHWDLMYLKVSGIRKAHYFSELKLSNEWTLVCVWKIHNKTILKPHFIEIQRSITSDESLIFGTLSVAIAGKTESEHRFSKFMESGSSSCRINLELPNSDLDFSLHGNVNITSDSDRLANYFGNENNKKYIELKSLVYLSNDFEHLLNPQKPWLADVNLKCGDSSIPAHKIILSVRSPVFAAMFRNPMKENLENQVDITDVEAHVIRTMLAYMYTGKTSDLSVPLAADLLFAADKYQLCDLKTVCSDFLKDNINPENVLKIIILGDLHSEDLKSFALDYICNTLAQLSTLENTEEWKTLKKQTPALAIEVLTSLVKSRDKALVYTKTISTLRKSS